jgi:hypothetical protein
MDSGKQIKKVGLQRINIGWIKDGMDYEWKPMDRGRQVRKRYLQA